MGENRYDKFLVEKEKEITVNDVQGGSEDDIKMDLKMESEC
jgi:hypothetical protein